MRSKNVYIIYQILEFDIKGDANSSGSGIPLYKCRIANKILVLILLSSYLSFLKIQIYFCNVPSLSISLRSRFPFPFPYPSPSNSPTAQITD